MFTKSNQTQTGNTTTANEISFLRDSNGKLELALKKALILPLIIFTMTVLSALVTYAYFIPAMKSLYSSMGL